MATSQNGWDVLPTAPPIITVPGTAVRMRVHPGDVSTILAEVATRFHHEVENLDLYKDGDEWGWAFREVRGSHTVMSNHASGTAIDLNATRHPRGVAVSRTFTETQVAAIKRILAALFDAEVGHPVVRWGGSFQTVPDGMHFEIATTSREALKRVADRIKLKNAQPAAHKPTPSKNAKGTGMDWNEKVALTAKDAEIWNRTLAKGAKKYVEGDLVTIGSMLRYPSLARKIDTKVDALSVQVAALAKQVANLTEILAQRP